MRNLLLLLLVFVCAGTIQAQSVDELKAQKAAKEAALAALQGEIDGLTGQIAELDPPPAWIFKGTGIVGFNALANNNWYALGTPNSANNGLSLAWSGAANYDVEKMFWNNSLNVNLSRSAAFSDKANDLTKVISLTNGLDLASLFGYKLTPKLAASIEGKYTSSLVEFDDNSTPAIGSDDKYPFALNSPGQATISAGVTWLPIKDLVVIVHPLAFQKNWPGDFISAPGAKIGATYSSKLMEKIGWASNLSVFVPYSGAGDVNHMNGDALLKTVAYSTGDLVTWEWVNGLSTNLWKGIGVSFNLGLRGNQQVADLGRLKAAADAATIDISDNPLQSYYTLGLSYTF